MSNSTGKNRKRSRKKQKKKNNLAAMLVILVVAFILCLLLMLESFKLQKRIDAGRSKNAALNTSISEEEDRTKRIESLREYISTDEYVKQAAKDRLGLVESGELVLKPEDDKN